MGSIVEFILRCIRRSEGFPLAGYFVLGRVDIGLGLLSIFAVVPCCRVVLVHLGPTLDPLSVHFLNLFYVFICFRQTSSTASEHFEIKICVVIEMFGFLVKYPLHFWINKLSG